MSRRRGVELVGGTQLDLFGQVEADLARRDAIAEAQAEIERRARYWPDGTEVRWVAPYDTGGGMKEGEDCEGWRCWLCGDIEPSMYTLGINHGLQPYFADTLEVSECTKQALLRRQAEHDQRTASAPTRDSEPAKKAAAARKAPARKGAGKAAGTSAGKTSRSSAATGAKAPARKASAVRSRRASGGGAA